MANKRSFYLNEKWDLTLSPSGDISTTSGIYCDAQNVANAVRLFTNDAYLRRQKGVPHFNLDLAIKPLLSEVRYEYKRAAESIENIRSASVEITGLDDETRTLTGIISAVTLDGESLQIEI